MDNIKYLLQKLSLVHDKSKIRRSQQESFNIFTTLLDRDNEVNLHSRFISSILDPNSPHKLGDTLLKVFLKVIDSSFVYDIQNLEVIPSTSTWTEYKEIDILLIDRKNKTAVIIENKINASDSNHLDEGQLERYYRRIVEEDYIPADNVEVYYLRPYSNTPPSDDSVSKSNKYPELPSKVRCISYECEISKWIKLCIKEVPNSPFLRETLNQYLRLIKEMTNNTDIQESLDIIEILSKSEDSLRSAKVLFDNYDQIRRQTIASFWNDLYEELEHRGYKISRKVDEEIIKEIDFERPKKSQTEFVVNFTNSKNIVFTIEADYNYFPYFGIRTSDNKGRIKEIKDLYKQNIHKIIRINDCPEDGWVFFLDFDVPDDEQISLWDFKHEGTFNLIRKENRIKSIKKHIDDFENVCKMLKLK